VARRIDIELTSSRPDGNWTWRAAGALQPKGLLDGALLFQGAKVGDVLRADAEFEIDGITIVAVTPPKQRHRSEPERLELIPRPASEPGVTAQLVGRGRSARDGRRSPGDDRTDPARPRSSSPRPERPRPGGHRPADGPGAEQRSGPRPERRSADARFGGRPGPGSRSSSPEPHGRPRPPAGAGTAPPRQRGPAQPEVGRAGAETAGRRLNPGNTHRHAALEALPPEQRPVAEQVLRGGIPAVRTAIHLEREKAAAEGRPAPHAESLLALAEELLPRMKAAEWRDRAEAAIKAVDRLALRDLRSVVAGADLARDEETRRLAAELRDALEQRLARGRAEWSDEIGRHLDEGRVVRALRLAARPPEPAARLSAELAGRLAAAAGAALAPDVAPERWAAVLDAAAASPVRRNVTPAGLPAEPGPTLLAAATQQVGRIPALAPMLGISMPPPPGPVRAVAPTDRPSPQRPGRPARTSRATPPSRPARPDAGHVDAAPTGPSGEPADETGPGSQPTPADTGSARAEAGPAGPASTPAEPSPPVAETPVDPAATPEQAAPAEPSPPVAETPVDPAATPEQATPEPDGADVQAGAGPA